MTRKKVIALRVTEAEMEKAKEVADQQGLSVSAYLRRCIKIAPMPEKPKQQAA